MAEERRVGSATRLPPPPPGTCSSTVSAMPGYPTSVVPSETRHICGYSARKICRLFFPTLRMAQRVSGEAAQLPVFTGPGRGVGGFFLGLRAGAAGVPGGSRARPAAGRVTGGCGNNALETAGALNVAFCMPTAPSSPEEDKYTNVRPSAIPATAASARLTTETEEAVASRGRVAMIPGMSVVSVLKSTQGWSTSDNRKQRFERRPSNGCKTVRKMRDSRKLSRTSLIRHQLEGGCNP